MGKGVHRCGRIGLGPSPFCAYIGSLRDGFGIYNMDCGWGWDMEDVRLR